MFLFCLVERSVDFLSFFEHHLNFPQSLQTEKLKKNFMKNEWIFERKQN